jgi:hypothetical protein
MAILIVDSRKDASNIDGLGYRRTRVVGTEAGSPIEAAARETQADPGVRGLTGFREEPVL